MDIMNNWLTRFAELIGSSVCRLQEPWAALLRSLCVQGEGIYGFYLCHFVLFFRKQGELPLYIIITLALFHIISICRVGFSFSLLNQLIFPVYYRLPGRKCLMTIVFLFSIISIIQMLFLKGYFPALQFAVFISVSAVFITMGLAGITVINMSTIMLHLYRFYSHFILQTL